MIDLISSCRASMPTGPSQGMKKTPGFEDSRTPSSPTVVTAGVEPPFAFVAGSRVARAGVVPASPPAAGPEVFMVSMSGAKIPLVASLPAIWPRTKTISKPGRPSTFMTTPDIDCEIPRSEKTTSTRSPSLPRQLDPLSNISSY